MHEPPIGLPARLWQSPDPLLAEAGAEGEWLAAQIRLVVVALLLITPFYRFIQAPWVGENITGLAVTIIGWIFAVVIYLYLRSGRYAPAVGFFSAGLDVTLVSIALFTFVLTGPPHAAANSRVTFPIYFLAISATSLRYDRRICIVAGALAITQYLGVVAYEEARWGFNDPRFAPYEYGPVTIADQFNRSILLASMTILAYGIVRRAENLRRAVVKDMLTDLPNRAYIETRGAGEFSRARRYQQPLAVVLIDIDRFKMFNDRYGHATGDRVLRVIAHTLRDHLRVSDVVARYGGEEFLVLLPQTDREGALEKIQDLLREVASIRLPVAKAPPEPLTISAGIACFPEDGDSLEALMLEADRRLLRAKQEGRNRVIATAAPASS